MNLARPKVKIRSRAEFTYVTCLMLYILINIFWHEDLSLKTKNQICRIIRLSPVAASWTGGVTLSLPCVLCCLEVDVIQ